MSNPSGAKLKPKKKAGGASAQKLIRELRAENNFTTELCNRQADLLRGVVNALKGAPPPDTTWSHHDAPELALKAAKALREIALLCANDEGTLFGSYAETIFSKIPHEFLPAP